MPWKDIMLGPFLEGLNLASDPSALTNQELVDCQNLEVEIDGTLVTRPPIKLVGSPPASATRLRFLEGVTLNGISYIIVASDTTVWSFNGTVFTSIATNVNISSVVQYKEKAYFVAYSTSPSAGGSWDGTTYVSLAAIPRGHACVIWKERMWVADGAFTAKLSFSNIADPALWGGADFFLISPGDGERLRDVVIFNNNLLMFKEDSVFGMSYDTKPADAVINKISNTIGVSGWRCIAQHKNVVYVYHEGKVYEMVNYDFVQINIKVPFAYDASAPSTRADNALLFMIGDRLIVRYFNKIYQYGTQTKAWTRWESADSSLHNFGLMCKWPQNVVADIVERYFGGSTLAGSNVAFQIQDGFTATDAESVPIICSIMTKDYDVGISWKFKRLFFWGTDVVSAKAVTGIATPIVLNFTATWGDIRNIPWNSLNTWALPTTQSIEVTTNIAGGAGTPKRFMKFNKGLRFRQAHFQVKLTTDGTSLDGPTKLYTITLFISDKQVVSKGVS